VVGALAQERTCNKRSNHSAATSLGDAASIAAGAAEFSPRDDFSLLRWKTNISDRLKCGSSSGSLYLLQQPLIFLLLLLLDGAAAD
jgi:hypothetical protein